MGSTSFSSVRLGSAFEMTALAAISSPVESTTPLAAPSFTRTSMTSAPLRISAPACCAAAAMACVTRPCPRGEPCRARGMLISSGAHQQNQAAARGPRTEECAEDAAGGDGRAQQFRLEVFRHQIGHRHRAPSAAGGTYLSCPVCGWRVRFAACPRDRLCWGRRCSAEPASSALPITLPILASDA